MKQPGWTFMPPPAPSLSSHDGTLPFMSEINSTSRKKRFIHPLLVALKSKQNRSNQTRAKGGMWIFPRLFFHLPFFFLFLRITERAVNNTGNKRGKNKVWLIFVSHHGDDGCF